ncbi:MULTISPECIES: type I methionyl aminopeptidase [Tepidanaerobacter]|uniref:Methionine aminopeptidase n=1 Tax=Tepidanaerobacter syntrophicus TaxID=224999 RepID=A0A0U9HLG5_9FIRM|nr:MULTISPECIES: type I methionyl aminopeptidase [Tepidanaerobacter]GAQ24673.1 methionyl aminopeptidase [Tepidanaerobacter syntrophicus]GLI19058.1 methionine aminopeptidase [Tepidanaerobacter syntrophicus]GLI51067.1 methionine aminopeptidase [Tepidanaerobacter syntrophicus]HHV83412.1 type I methionyl aminopeptidase [Tepidanaerobacter syntrophicus]
MIIIKSQREIELMRKAGKITALTLEEVKKHVRPGITTLELNRIAEDFILSHNCLPTFKGYHGFPAAICTSVNEEVVHGIPGPRVLKEGDIISIDVGVIFEGYNGDAARTFPVGQVEKEALRLVEVTKQSFFEGIAYAKPGYRLSDISHAVQKYVEANNFSVVKDYVGHGIGRDMHEDPQIPNFGPPGKGPRLRRGMTLAIEPMVNMGGYEVYTLDNNWTVVTEDGSLSAHYENTIAITDGEPEILTMI